VRRTLLDTLSVSQLKRAARFRASSSTEASEAIPETSVGDFTEEASLLSPESPVEGPGHLAMEVSLYCDTIPLYLPRILIEGCSQVQTRCGGQAS